MVFTCCITVPFLISSDPARISISPSFKFPKISTKPLASLPTYTLTRCDLLFTTRITNTLSVELTTADDGTINVLSLDGSGRLTSATIPGSNFLSLLITSISTRCERSRSSMDPDSRLMIALNTLPGNDFTVKLA